MNNLVTAVIPSYNRYAYLKDAIESVNIQLENSKIKIIVINDGSTQPEYKKNLFPDNVKVLNLNKNQKILNGYSSDAIRNLAIDEINTKYIAFLDDDDCWLQGKLSKQLDKMQKFNYKFSATEGFIGKGKFNSKNKYQKYNSEYYFEQISKKYVNNSLIDNFKGYKSLFTIPETINKEFLSVHNVIITSSVVVEKEVFCSVGMFDSRLPNGIGDYECWKKILNYHDCLYINEPLFYYDLNHAEGSYYDL